MSKNKIIRLDEDNTSIRERKKIINVSGIYAGDCRWVDNAKMVQYHSDADLLIFPGGGDVNPKLYGEPVGKHTWFSEHTDKNQIAVYKANVGKRKLFGICRGLQLLHVMAGGKLVQDISHGQHGLITYDGQRLHSNSLHHQQVMFAGMKEGEDYVLLAWSTERSPYHMNGKGEDYNFPADYRDPEVVYYPKIGAMGMQGHPEMMSPNSETVAWLNKQVRKYLFNEK